MLGLVSLIVSIVALGVALHAEPLAGDAKWTCGTVRCFTDDEDQPAIVLTTGKIPEYDGYWLVCCIKSIPDEVQMAITDEGEVVG